ncbi:hypothetical protein [Bradyrhizobium sp. SYSU BS000235]|uniref:hypothetical protein n=1 Tax=Bradyrhizobium sp. SYSU BS000235 TaxID=3411332 RepID=UPI003C752789
MDREKPNSDLRQRTDKKTFEQTNEPWKQPVEKEQDPGELTPDDLERWHKTNTH